MPPLIALNCCPISPLFRLSFACPMSPLRMASEPSALAHEPSRASHCPPPPLSELQMAGGPLALARALGGATALGAGRAARARRAGGYGGARAASAAPSAIRWADRAVAPPAAAPLAVERLVVALVGAAGRGAAPPSPSGQAARSAAAHARVGGAARSGRGRTRRRVLGGRGTLREEHVLVPAPINMASCDFTDDRGSTWSTIAAPRLPGDQFPSRRRSNARSLGQLPLIRLPAQEPER